MPVAWGDLPEVNLREVARIPRIAEGGSFCQQHFLRCGEISGPKFIEVRPGRKVTRIPRCSVLTRAKHAVDECCNLPSQRIRNYERHGPHVLDLKFKLGPWVERIRVILGQAVMLWRQAVRRLDSHDGGRGKP